MKKELKLSPGQTLRYSGRAFAGFVKDQPYMTFVAYHSVHEIVVKYNDTEVIINKFHIDPVK